MNKQLILINIELRQKYLLSKNHNSHSSDLSPQRFLFRTRNSIFAINSDCNPCRRPWIFLLCKIISVRSFPQHKTSPTAISPAANFPNTNFPSHEFPQQQLAQPLISPTLTSPVTNFPNNNFPNIVDSNPTDFFTFKKLRIFILKLRICSLE